MKIKNKGKVYPSPSPSPSPSSSSVAANRDDVFSVLKLLPAAIFALASVVSLQDREVLAYMIARSIETATTASSSPSSSVRKRSSKKASNTSNGSNNHNKPSFHCDCFDCYRSYWLQWDSSPNRELIHQVIEAFEEHLSSAEHSKKKGKRRDKTAHKAVDKSGIDASREHQKAVLMETDDSVASTTSKNDDVEEDRQEEEAASKIMSELVPISMAEAEEKAVVARTSAAVSNHRGLTRKVLPDVLGLLNSRLWSLWSPNV